MTDTFHTVYGKISLSLQFFFYTILFLLSESNKEDLLRIDDVNNLQLLKKVKARPTISILNRQMNKRTRHLPVIDTINCAVTVQIPCFTTIRTPHSQQKAFASDF